MIGVVVAHPDDEILGMGASIAKFIAAEEKVSILYMGTGRIGGRQKQGAESAASTLGFDFDFAFAPAQDNQFDAVPLLTLVHCVERWLNGKQIDELYTHHRGDLNIDHRFTFQAVLTATRPQPDANAPRALYSFEVPSSTEWAFDGSFVPNVFIDVGRWWAKKTQALQAYFDEMRAYPHPRSLQALEARARYLGSIVGLDMAEAFQLVRIIA